MRKTKIAIIIFASIIILVGGTVLIFNNTNYYKSVEVSKELVVAIGDHNLSKVEEIITQHPKSVNTLPSISPWWWQLITEQPSVSFPLQRACWGGDYDIVKLLIDNGADVNLVWKGIEGSKSPLMRAVLSGSERTEQIVELLLENGADKSMKDSSEKTAYDYAVEKGDIELAELLKP